jgi:hypothetical protein
MSIRRRRRRFFCCAVFGSPPPHGDGGHHQVVVCRFDYTLPAAAAAGTNTLGILLPASATTAWRGCWFAATASLQATTRFHQQHPTLMDRIHDRPA